MHHFILLLALSMSAAVPVPRGATKPTGILVLDNCDDQYRGKEAYEDNLTLLDSAGNQTFRVSGFNNCESIGSSRMIAADRARKCIWGVLAREREGGLQHPA